MSDRTSSSVQDRDSETTTRVENSSSENTNADANTKHDENSYSDQIKMHIRATPQRNSLISV